MEKANNAPLWCFAYGPGISNKLSFSTLPGGTTFLPTCLDGAGFRDTLVKGRPATASEKSDGAADTVFDSTSIVRDRSGNQKQQNWESCTKFNTAVTDSSIDSKLSIFDIFK